MPNNFAVEELESSYGLAIPTTGLFHGDDLLVQVEHHIDLDPENPRAWKTFRQRLSQLPKERDIWRTIVVDSITFAEIAARLESQYDLNKTARDPRKHYAHSTEELERAIMIRMGSLPCNAVVLCHIDETIVQDESNPGGKSIAVKDEVNGVMVRNPAAPGRLRKRLPGGYTCLFRSYVEYGANGERAYVWQTEPDSKWNAGNNLGAPSPCDAYYDALFANWQGLTTPLVRVVAYGDPMSGKSTAFASFPKPMLVFSFDPQGKELPYLTPKETWHAADSGFLVAA